METLLWPDGKKLDDFGVKPFQKKVLFFSKYIYILEI